MSDIILNGILGLAGIAVLVSLWNMHRSNGRGNPIYRNFNLAFLIVNKDGFPDGAKCIEMIAVLLLSWGFIVYMTSPTKVLPEWYLITYVTLCIGRGAYGAHLRAKGGDVPETPGTKTEVTVTTTEVKPLEEKKP